MGVKERIHPTRGEIVAFALGFALGVMSLVAGVALFSILKGGW